MEKIKDSIERFLRNEANRQTIITLLESHYCENIKCDCAYKSPFIISMKGKLLSNDLSGLIEWLRNQDAEQFSNGYCVLGAIVLEILKSEQNETNK